MNVVFQRLEVVLCSITGNFTPGVCKGEGRGGRRGGGGREEGGRGEGRGRGGGGRRGGEEGRKEGTSRQAYRSHQCN